MLKFYKLPKKGGVPHDDRAKQALELRLQGKLWKQVAYLMDPPVAETTASALALRYVRRYGLEKKYAECFTRLGAGKRKKLAAKREKAA